MNCQICKLEEKIEKLEKALNKAEEAYKTADYQRFMYKEMYQCALLDLAKIKTKMKKDKKNGK